MLPNFRFEDGPLKKTLPEKYLPNCHVNYDNRARDVHDGLPKMTAARGENVPLLCDDEGNLLA